MDDDHVEGTCFGFLQRFAGTGFFVSDTDAGFFAEGIRQQRNDARIHRTDGAGNADRIGRGGRCERDGPAQRCKAQHHNEFFCGHGISSGTSCLLTLSFRRERTAAVNIKIPARRHALKYHGARRLNALRRTMRARRGGIALPSSPESTTGTVESAVGSAAGAGAVPPPNPAGAERPHDYCCRALPRNLMEMTS